MMISRKRIETSLFYLLILFLPTQLGKHFWPAFAYVDGIRVDYLAPTLYLTDLLLVGLLLCWVGRLRVVRLPIRKVHRSPLFWYLLFLIFVVLSVMISSTPALGWYQLLKFLEYSFFFLYVSQTVSSFGQLRTITLLLSLGVVGESFLAFAQYFQQSSIGGIFYWFGERAFTATTPGIANTSLAGELVLRPYGTFSHPNVLAGYLILSLLLISFMLFTAKQWVFRWWLLFVLVLGTGGLVLTMSRITNLLWFVCLFVGGMFLLKKGKALSFLSVSVGIIVLFFIGLVLAHPLMTRISESQLTEESFTSRMILTHDALSLLIQHPLWGVGLGNSIQAISSLQEIFSPDLFLQPVHNVFLFIGVELGFVGLLFLVGLLVTTYHHLFRHIQSSAKHQQYASLCCILLTLILLLGLVDHYWVTLQQGQLLFALILGLSWSRLFR